MKTTKRKSKIIGKKTYLDQSTGELVDMNVVHMEDTDFNFEKIWLGHILQALDCMGSKKIKVVTWLLDNKNFENTIIATQRDISIKCQVSLPIVTETLKILQKGDILKMKQNGVYMLNPNVIFKGDKNKRLNILLMYNRL
ncbi:replication/maintenance protein RepL (plasmid) [Arsenophonus nasoniae]|uniref:Firmicute plasmid replication protein (RepL) n=1 Tax=Arsenophonus nasoniae TaxID=638 RepID=A0A4P7L099_9GAMM|nr:replication/maintenance protein RepL [Arsenophonus nasoniae]QBY45935.1 Firmicute plasmid replication protein (RepL) [Arsenophonus nasoniae]QBY46109.1 Firmicute plasmid replication protein (RepL) [Arsenophonus nasoniae]WGM08511.1 replication/maintenance protein RepL [Arsenophonus nasoniae]WGM13758.1 replication/maintenance protein RepL [Arsenophonus nasoniae]WGM18394.1 replication/maintenance protein RepL [Arsenophonus nasoniae]